MWARLRSWYRRRAGARIRSALAATVVVAVVLAAAAATFLYLYRRSLIGAVDADAARHAQAVAADFTRTGVPSGVLAPERGTPGPAQVVAPDGTVVAASAALRDAPAVTRQRPAPGQVLREDGRLPTPGAAQSDNEYRVVAVGVATDQGTYTVLAAESLASVDESVEVAAALLVIGCPLLVAVVGGATYVFVGRALAPVDAIRRTVAEIGADRLGERVPVPEADDEVSRLAGTMNTMLDRLETQVDARRRFVADAGHELRSPMTTLRGGLELLGTRDLAARDAELVALLGDEAARMDHLVDSLLLLARGDDNGPHMRTGDVDLDDLADAERRRLAAQHPNLTVTAALTPVRVQGDADQLARVLRNLADNAAAHAADTVRLTLTRTDGTAVLEVTDDGPGVPAGERERVFDRFVRLDASRHRSTGGSGLGLAIVRQVVGAHGGTVSAHEAPGGGALFRVRLPLDRPLDGSPNRSPR